MSKLDAQRAMREAKYARSQAQGAARTSTRPRATPPVAPPDPAGPPAAPLSSPAPAGASDTCGHRSMNGRTCTRDAGHSEKNHRYS